MATSTVEAMVRKVAQANPRNDQQVKPQMANGLNISEARQKVGLEACWEVAAICETLRTMTSDLACASRTAEDLMRTSLLIRGMTCRIEQLGNVAMSIFDGEDRTRHLARQVYGDWPVEAPTPELSEVRS